jgi:hypothetical protein
MRWYKDLYLGDSVKHRKRYYKYCISYSKKLTGTYCIVLSQNDGGLLDICHSELLRFPFTYRNEPLIIGIAGSKSEACLLAGDIIQDVVKETGGTDLHSYFQERE